MTGSAGRQRDASDSTAPGTPTCPSCCCCRLSTVHLVWLVHSVTQLPNRLRGGAHGLTQDGSGGQQPAATVLRLCWRLPAGCCRCCRCWLQEPSEARPDGDEDWQEQVWPVLKESEAEHVWGCCCWCAADVDRVQDTAGAEFEDDPVIALFGDGKKTGKQQVDQRSPLLLILRVLRKMGRIWESRVHENALVWTWSRHSLFEGPGSRQHPAAQKKESFWAALSAAAVATTSSCHRHLLR